MVYSDNNAAKVFKLFAFVSHLCLQNTSFKWYTSFDSVFCAIFQQTSASITFCFIFLFALVK